MLVDTTESKQASLIENVWLENIAIYMISRNKTPENEFNENTSRRLLGSPQFLYSVSSPMALGAILLL